MHYTDRITEILDLIENAMAGRSLDERQAMAAAVKDYVSGGLSKESRMVRKAKILGELDWHPEDNQ